MPSPMSFSDTCVNVWGVKVKVGGVLYDKPLWSGKESPPLCLSCIYSKCNCVEDVFPDILPDEYIFF